MGYHLHFGNSISYFTFLNILSVLVPLFDSYSMLPIDKDLETVCEQTVVAKLIKLAQIALDCSSENIVTTNISLLTAGEEALAKWLINQNETSFDTGTTISDNSTDVQTQDTPIVEDNGKFHKLQHLEMIKVGVLIFVISIIMLTTCRMLFQLVVRFKPDKPIMM